MKYENYFRDIFESIPNYRKIILLLFLIKDHKGFLLEISFSERDISCLNSEFRNVLKKQLEEYLDFVKNQEESIIERFLNK